MNKYERALHHLTNRDYFGMDKDDEKMRDLLFELADKETPMKPKASDFMKNISICKNCYHSMTEDFNENYCGYCGQKIDWTDVDE